jgi:hypothetical protein
LKQLVPCTTPVKNNDNDEDEEVDDDGTSDNAGSADGSIGHRLRQRNHFLDPSMPPKMFLIVLREKSHCLKKI